VLEPVPIFHNKNHCVQAQIISSPDDFRSLQQFEKHGRKLYNALLGILLSDLSQMKGES